MIDIADRFKTIHREVHRRGESVGVLPQRSYDATAEDAGEGEVQRFHLGSIALWEAVVRESGTATEEEPAASVAVAKERLAPDVRD